MEHGGSSQRRRASGSLSGLWLSAICDATTLQCGSGLARESGVSANTGLTDTARSRASPLPHFSAPCRGQVGACSGRC
ncbi:hypothetical protein DXV65_03100 [Pseudomonas fluorescens]|nr:hypothetical protein DXV65_03100 [Pseudomonas fluorescens]